MKGDTLTPHLHGPWEGRKKISAEVKGLVRLTKETPTNRGGQEHGALGKPKANKAALQGQGITPRKSRTSPPGKPALGETQLGWHRSYSSALQASKHER